MLDRRFRQTVSLGSATLNQRGFSTNRHVADHQDASFIRSLDPVASSTIPLKPEVFGEHHGRFIG